MWFACMLPLVSVLPVTASQPVSAPVPQFALGATQRSPDEFRDAYADALRKTARRAHPDPYALVPELADLYRDLQRASGLAHSEKSRMRHGLKSRLQQFRWRLLRDARQLTQQERLRRYRASRSGRTDGLAGGRGELSRAIELVELIQNTIAPESWEAGGGNGSIRYYRPLKVLVIRQTGEVHHQIGGVLKQLRK